MTRNGRAHADQSVGVRVAGAFGRRQKALGTTWSRKGVEMLVAAAISVFESATGTKLPWNLAVWGPWVGYPKAALHLQEEAQEMVSVAARFAGWLRAAATLPALTWLVAKATSSAGMNSPYTAVNLYDLAKAWPSPGRLARTIAQVRARANEILKPYGLRVSARAIALVVIRKGDQRAIGKMARRAASGTVNQLLRGRFTGKPVEVLSKACGMKLFLAAYRNSMYARAVQCWAVERVEAGEFACLRDAMQASSRLQEAWRGSHQVVVDPASQGVVIHGVLCRPAWAEKVLLWQVCQSSTGRESYPPRWGQTTEEVVDEALANWRGVYGPR